MNLRLQFFMRYLFSRRSGTIIRTMGRLCVMATLIGVLALIVVSSIMNGFNRSIRTKLLRVEPHVVVLPKNRSEWESIGASLRAIVPETEGRVSSYSKSDVILRSLEGTFAGAIAKGLSAQNVYKFLNDANKTKFKGVGEDLPPELAELGPRDLAMGVDLARELNVFEGDELMVISPESMLLPKGELPRFERMRIKTLFSTEFPEIDSKLMVFSDSEVQQRFESTAGTEYGFEVHLQDPRRYEEIADLIKNKTADVDVETWADRNSSLFLALKLEKVAMSTFLGLSILITCFSLITVLILLLSQKRKDIGLLMAVGLSARKTKNLFMALGICLSGFGLFAGLFLGVVMSDLIARYPVDILPDIYYDSSLPSEISYTMVGFVAVGSLLVAFIAAYLPVRLYLQRSPSENLRQFIAD